jgi:hypothetical protein
MDNHFTALWDGGHIKFFSVPTMKDLLKSENYTNIKFKLRVDFLTFGKVCCVTVP